MIPQRTLTRAAGIAWRRGLRVLEFELASYPEREAVKRAAWERLHGGDYALEHIVAILNCWGDSELRISGMDGRVPLSVFCEWAAGINEKLRTARAALQLEAVA